MFWSPVACSMYARALRRARLLRAADGRSYAEVPVEGRFEIYGLKSTFFRDWLIIRCLAERGVAPSGKVVGRVLGLLESKSRCEGATRSLEVRVGRAGAPAGMEYYLDLANADGQAVKISAGVGRGRSAARAVSPPAGATATAGACAGRIDRAVTSVRQCHRA